MAYRQIAVRAAAGAALLAAAAAGDCSSAEEPADRLPAAASAWALLRLRRGSDCHDWRSYPMRRFRTPCH